MDTENSAQGAPRRGSAYGPTGFRRLTPGLIKVDRTAEGFAGLPDGVTVHGQLLAAFKAAAPRLGLARAWCMRSTGCSALPSRRTGSGEGGRSSGRRPRCSRRRSALSETQAKRLNRHLIETRPDHHEGQPERQALRQARRSGADRRGLRLRSVADCRAPCGIRAAGGGGEGGAGGDGAAAPAGDDRAQGHRPDPRDRARLRFKGRGMADVGARGSGDCAGAEARRAAGRDGRGGCQPGTAAARGAEPSRDASQRC